MICNEPIYNFAKRENHHWLCINIRPLADFSAVDISQGFKKEGKSQSDDEVLVFALKRTWSKLNTVYWTFTIPYFTAESGWHAFYNQSFLTKRPGKFFQQSESLCQSDNENNCGEFDARANRCYESCPFHFLTWFHFIHRNSRLFLLFFLFVFLLLKAKIGKTPHLFINHKNL